MLQGCSCQHHAAHDVCIGQWHQCEAACEVRMCNSLPPLECLTKCVLDKGCRIQLDVQMAAQQCSTPQSFNSGVLCLQQRDRGAQPAAPCQKSGDTKRLDCAIFGGAEAPAPARLHQESQDAGREVAATDHGSKSSFWEWQVGSCPLHRPDHPLRCSSHRGT